MSTKNLLKAAGVMMLLLAIMHHLASMPVKEPESIWEEVSEETYTNIYKERETEDMVINGPVQEIETGECKEAPQATGQITEEEQLLLMKIAQAEAGNQGEEGMWLVMSVIMNRVDSPDFPDSIKEVIFQDYQFTSVTDDNYDSVVILSVEASEALERILRGDIAPKIIGFEVKTSEELDKYFVAAFEFRDHRFYVAKSD